MTLTLLFSGYSEGGAVGMVGASVPWPMEARGRPNQRSTAGRDLTHCARASPVPSPRAAEGRLTDADRFAFHSGQQRRSVEESWLIVPEPREGSGS